MEAQISAGMKTPTLSSRPGPEGSAGDKGRKRESETLSRTQSTDRDEQVSQTFIHTKQAFITLSCCQKKKKKITKIHHQSLYFHHYLYKCVNFDLGTFIPYHF